MVGVKKVNKIWLIRESKGSNTYYLTGDPEFVKYFKLHRRHWGNLIWTRGLIEDNRYSYWAHLWLLKTYLIILENTGKGDWFIPWPHINPGSDQLKTDIGTGLYEFNPKLVLKDTYRFDFSKNRNSSCVIKCFRNRLRFIEGVIWKYRNFLGECSLDYPNLKFLIEPRRGLPKTPSGAYDHWRMPEPPKEQKSSTSRIAKIWKKVRAALRLLFFFKV